MKQTTINAKNALTSSSIFGVNIFSGQRREMMDWLSDELSKRGKNDPIILFTPNPEQLRLARHDQRFQHALQQATMNIPDGSGVVWALKRRGQVSAVRIPGRELFHELLGYASKQGQTLVLVGGRQGSAQKIVELYDKEGFWFVDPGARTIREETEEERVRVHALITQVKPTMLFVAYGAPWQEEWVIANREFLRDAGVRLVMVVGGAFEYEAGKVASVPSFVEHLHLEWAYRLLQEPWRWKRQLIGLEFFIRILMGEL